ncbi:MAG: hypothetical protein JWN99_460 [Ilumatobacteraceae bacterium]|nr:hypothetical protein [Ilumatobacteraceae bacterium]
MKALRSSSSSASPASDQSLTWVLRVGAAGTDVHMVLDKKEIDRLPATLKRSPAKAQATYMHTLEAAEEDHGDGEAAHRIAFGSLKHSFEKVGDHWEPKDERGPSDDQDEKTGLDARKHPVETAGGVDARASKAHLMQIAKRLDVHGRSSMNKADLIVAIDKANRAASVRSLDRTGRR